MDIIQQENFYFDDRHWFYEHEHLNLRIIKTDGNLNSSLMAIMIRPMAFVDHKF